MNGKTPVTLLHEYLSKEGEVPDYKLVYDGVGTHDPVFQYEVSAKNKIAYGKGKSKKEAKHDAARMLLLQLNEVQILDEEMEVVSPYADAIKENQVGALLEFCLLHNTAPPKYELIRDEGLAHAKIFGFRCTVSSIITEAEARTKKQAKQQASCLMLLKLQECLEDPNISIATENIPEVSELTEKACNATKEAFDKVFQERLVNEKTYCKLGTSLGRFSEQFIENVVPFSETLRSIADSENSSFENPEEILMTILTELDFKYNFGFLDTHSASQYLCCLHIKELNDPHFIGLSTDQESAKKNAVVKALEFFSVMAKT